MKKETKLTMFCAAFDWKRPHVHLGGHVLDPEGFELHGANQKHLCDDGALLRVIDVSGNVLVHAGGA